MTLFFSSLFSRAGGSVAGLRNEIGCWLAAHVRSTASSFLFFSAAHVRVLYPGDVWQCVKLYLYVVDAMCVRN